MRILRKLERFIFCNVPENSSQEGLGTIWPSEPLGIKDFVADCTWFDEISGSRY